MGVGGRKREREKLSESGEGKEEMDKHHIAIRHNTLNATPVDAEDRDGRRRTSVAIYPSLKGFTGWRRQRDQGVQHIGLPSASPTVWNELPAVIRRPTPVEADDRDG